MDFPFVSPPETVECDIPPDTPLAEKSRGMLLVVPNEFPVVNFEPANRHVKKLFRRRT